MILRHGFLRLKKFKLRRNQSRTKLRKLQIGEFEFIWQYRCLANKTENRNASEKTRNRALLEEFISRRNDSTAQKGDRIRVKLKPKPNFKVILHVKVVEWALAMVGVTMAVRQVWFWVDCPKYPIFKIQSFWLI